MIKSTTRFSLIWLMLLFLLFNTAFGQTPLNPLSKAVMIQLYDAEDIESLKSEISKSPHIGYKEALTRDGLVHSLELKANNIKEFDHLIQWLENRHYVEFSEEYREVRPRASERPNDTNYSDQYQMINMEMEKVWCTGNNPIIASGDTIVLAVVEFDSTFFLNSDLVENLYINHRELPGDGIDNDNNGYIDDYYGIEATTERGFGLTDGPSKHSLGVMGIIGAEGDNNELLAGMAWNIKILNIVRAQGNFEAVKAYDYLYNLRKTYNETNGREGAYIVASNSSFGLDEGFAPNYPIWCERYNLMSSVGILNVAAVRNQEVDIDLEGDIPGQCPSDGLITVTNLTPEDEAGRSGYSAMNVDIAAYGTDVPLLDDSDTIYFHSGASFSAPLVTGLIGLFYGQACEDFIQLSKDEPEKAVKTMKSFILDKALPIPSQIGRTVTEGKLDPLSSQNLMFDYCGTTNSTLEIDRIYYNLSRQLVIEFNVPDPGVLELSIHNALGIKVHERQLEVATFEPWVYTIDGDHFPTGIYYLSIEKEGKIDSQPFIWIED